MYFNIRPIIYYLDISDNLKMSRLYIVFKDS